jgi:hypothetical protein
MQRVRITIRHNSADPAEDVRLAARARRDLWAHSPVEIDPDSPAHGTHRDAEGNAYFEFATDRLQEVDRVLKEYGHLDGGAMRTIVADGKGTECVNCGDIMAELLPVCPNCNFRDIDPCPYCNNDIARLAYIAVTGDVFRCPACSRLVRFSFHDPLFDPTGHYNQPLVRVNPAEAPVAHEV